MSEPDVISRPFSVLIVCTANQCRSPMAEHLLRQSLQERGVDWEISSAGTHARSGTPISPSAAVLLGNHGLDLSGWRSRELKAEMIERADVILTAEAAHRSRVVSLQPSALSRTFTLLQFAQLCAHLEPLSDPTGPRAGQLMLEGVRIARGHVQPGPPGSDDVADPIGRRMKAYRACAEIIQQAVDDIVAVLSPPVIASDTA